jgi:REP element-mobilizing transposase RayT
MPTGYQIKNQEAAYYLTFQIVFWIDVFTRRIYREIIIDSLKYCQKNKGLEIYAFVIMSNHIHLLVRSQTGELNDTVRDIKKYTSKHIIQKIQSGEESRKSWMLNLVSYAANRQNKKGEYQVWTHENHAVEVYSNDFIEQKVNYIHENPVRNGLVENPEDYVYSSARFYADQECVLDIIPVSFCWKTIR